jgi:hypothetical protein
MPDSKPNTSTEHQNAPDPASHDAAEGPNPAEPPRKKRRRRRSSSGVPGLKDMTKKDFGLVLGWPGPLPPRKPASEPEKPQGDHDQS